MKALAKFIIFNSFFVLPFIAQAQYGEIGLGIGATNYKGDLAKYPELAATRIGVEGFYRYNMSDAVSLRGGLFLGLLSGNDSLSTAPFQEVRAISFSGTAIELYLLAEYHFFNFRGRKQYPKYSPYLFGGLGAAFLTTSRDPDGGDSPSGINLVIPFGVGVKRVLNRRFILGLEFGTRHTFTDLIDGLTAEDEEFPQKFNRGNAQNNDKYYFLSVSLAYRFNKLRCPDPRPVFVR